MRVMLVDDHALFRTGMKNFLSGLRDMEIVGEADNGLEAIESWKKFKPDITILDIGLGKGMNGLEVARRIKKEDANARIIILTVSEDLVDIMEASQIGVEGYLIKKINPQEFLECINTIIKGETYVCKEIANQVFTGLHQIPGGIKRPYNLTKREIEVVELVVQGQTNLEIAHNLYISVSTVKKTMSGIMEKMGVHSRAEVAGRAISFMRGKNV